MDREDEMGGGESSCPGPQAENNLSEEEEEEEEDDEEWRESGIRCYQSDGENPGTEPHPLGAALTTSPGLASDPVSLLGSPRLSNSPDFEVELTAEVTLEGSVVGLLSSVVPRLVNRKTGVLPPAWTPPSPLGSSLQGVLDGPWPLGPLPPRPMDLTQGFKGRPPTPSSHGITETAKSPLPSSPSPSPSSPSSSPSSPSSSSPSPSAPVTGYHNDAKGHTEGAGVASVTGDMVTSTSASLAPPSLATPPLDDDAANNSFGLSSSRVGADGQSEGGEKEIYDPFHPTEGEREGGVAGGEEQEEEEEEGDKYDPFEPTGSPASDAEDGRPMEDEEDGRPMDDEEDGRPMDDEEDGRPMEDAGDGIPMEDEDGDGHDDAAAELRTTDEAERDTKSRGGGGEEEKEEAPPDSTDALPPPAAASPRATPPPPTRRRLDRDPKRTRGRGKERKKRQTANHSDHSEIEEGEIVGATDRDGGIIGGKRTGGLLTAGTFFGGAKPERILRVQDGDGFVSIRAEGDWIGPGAGLGMEDEEGEDEPVVGVGDLRRKLVSRRKERYHSCPASSSLSPQPLPLLPPPSPPSPSSSPLPPVVVEQQQQRSGKIRKASKNSKDRERRKRKEAKASGEKEERRRKRRKEKEGTPAEGASRDRGGDDAVVKGRRRKDGKEEKGRKVRSSRSDSRKRKKRRHSSPEATSHARNSTGKAAHGRRSRSSPVEEHQRERERDRDRDRDHERERERERERDRDKERDRDRDRDRDRERDRDRDRDRAGDRRRDEQDRHNRYDEQDRHNRDDEHDRHRDDEHDRHRDDEQDRHRDDNSSRRKRERERYDRRHTSSRERGSDKRAKRSMERSRKRREHEGEQERDRERQRDRERDGERDRERDGERDRDRERRRDGRPVVPPSIQDLNGSDLYNIKRTITVTTTMTTTTGHGSSPHDTGSPCSPLQDSDKPHKRKKRRRRSVDEDGGSRRSHSRSLSPPIYLGYDSDRYSDKLEIDMLSLDGEALDSDYPSLEDSPPAALPPQSPVLSSKENDPKSGRHHPKKKSRLGKKIGQSESSSSIRAKGKGLSSLSPTQATSGSGPISSVLTSAKRGRKVAKDKERAEKGGRKDSSRSGKSKKESGGSRKGKLQSKVSVLVREGVSSTTGASAGSGKLGMDLLGSGGPGGSNGGPVVGGSIAVVFRRDNESRSPFLKPCSEPLSLGGRNKDLSKVGKRSSLAVPPSSLSCTISPKSKKAKPSSTTSTSSSASSPSSSLATKRRRRLGKKMREKGGAGSELTDGDNVQSKSGPEGWGGTSSEIQSGVGGGTKSLSPHSGPAGPAPCSSSSSSTSSTSALPPSSSPPHTPPPSMGPSRDARESSPDSQTVDSSCKTPEPSFLSEDCPTQTTPNMPLSSPPTLSNSQGAALGISLSASNTKPLPLDDGGPKSLASPPCSSSSGSAPASLSLPPSSSDPSSSSSSSSVSSSSVNKLPPPPPPPPVVTPLPWSLQTGVDCTAGGVLALTALLFKMEEATIASRAKAQKFIQATSQILCQANQNMCQAHTPPSSTSSSSSSQIPPPPSLPPPPGPNPAQYILHGSLQTPPSHLHSGMSMGGGYAQTPPPPVPLFVGATGSGDTGWDNESKDPDKYLKKLHTQERAVEEVKLAIKPYYQRKDINKSDYKDILRKAVHKICHSRTGEINPMKVSNLVKLYVQRYKYFRKHGRKMDDEDRDPLYS